MGNPRLFQPVRIGQMELKNRIVMPPMGTNYGSDEGYVTERTRGYYEARARGGAGLIIVEATCIDAPVGKTMARQLLIDDDRFIPALGELAQAIKKHGARAAIQLHHAGNAARASLTGRQPVAPSPVTRPGYDPPRELTTAEVRELVSCFARAAERARRAGFDGVEVHGAHMYLIAQFLSSAWNRRQDEYGGELRNRARFLVEVIQAIRRAVGQTFPVWCRLNGVEVGLEGGITIEETREVAGMAEEAGVDALHISAWHPFPSQVQVWSMPVVPGHLIPLAAEIKRVVRLPVIAVGRIDAELAERVLQEGKADLVSMGRALIADPELANKAASGRLEDITPCTACWGCNESLHHTATGLMCQVNAATGRENEYRLGPAARAKRVLVVGGGPAGMEAARVAARRGHQVTLYEKGTQLGGQLISAVKPPHKGTLEPLTRYLVTQLRKLGVKVELEKEATPEGVAKLRPDAVILATGAIPYVPEIPGLDSIPVVTAEDVLLGRAATGDRVIVLGGELVGCETAEFLADQGKKVTITRRGPELATGVMPPFVRELLLARLSQKGVAVATGVRYQKATDRGLVITQDGKPRTIEADTIVLAAGSRPNAGLLRSLEGLVAEIHPVGDCLKPRRIRDAIHEGYRAALSL